MRPWQRMVGLILATAALGSAVPAAGQERDPGNITLELVTAPGYSGIWYMNQPTRDEYKYKYSGGFATYPQQHRPIAQYAPAVNRTFFCYGGTDPADGSLLHMVSYYDHATGTVPRPRILLDKDTDDAHDNPVLAIDRDGRIWIFSNAHGVSRPAFIHRSVEPYAIDRFERVARTNFSYGQPSYDPERGFLLLHTRYIGGHRVLHWMTSDDGLSWSEPRVLAHFEQGHYQVSQRQGRRVGTAFNMHPEPVGLNARTNLYYLQTDDAGATWTTADGQVMATPLTEVDSAALVHDYQAEHKLVYLKEVQFDAEGRPVLLYLTSRGFEPGPASGPRTWHTARWDGSQWRIRDITTSDHNYDFGTLSIDASGEWRLIAPTAPGPQPRSTGGEIQVWSSGDQGETWTLERDLTRNSQTNHTYVREVVGARDDFFALWADGNPLKPSASRLYVTDREGRHAWRLPAVMESDTARPEPVFGP